jgi:hypothetical protein
LQQENVEQQKESSIKIFSGFEVGADVEQGGFEVGAYFFTICLTSASSYGAFRQTFGVVGASGKIGKFTVADFSNTVFTTTVLLFN